LTQNLELKLEYNPVDDQEDRKPIEISILNNSVFYLLEIVFIAAVKEGYRLVVILKRKLLTDKIYKTSKGARIGFLKLWGEKAWRRDVKANWSRFYTPEKGGGEKKITYKK
jgi:hypothetical protein